MINGTLLTNTSNTSAGTTISADSIDSVVGVVYFVVAAAIGTGDAPSAVPSGWTQVEINGSGSRIFVLYRRNGSGSTFGCNVSWASSQDARSIQVWAIEGLDTTNPVGTSFLNAWPNEPFIKGTNGTFNCVVANANYFNLEPAATTTPFPSVLAGSYQPEATAQLDGTWTLASSYSRREVYRYEYPSPFTGDNITIELNSAQAAQSDYPAMIVEVSPTTYGTPRLDDMAWHEATTTSMTSDIALGRSDELANFDAGTCSLQLTEPLEVTTASLSVPAGGSLTIATDTLGEVATNDSLRLRLKVTPDNWGNAPFTLGTTDVSFYTLNSVPILEANAITYTCPNKVKFQDNDTGWLEVILVGDSALGFEGAVFYQSYDGQNWTCLGTSFDSTTTVSMAADTLTFANPDSTDSTQLHEFTIGTLDSTTQTTWLVHIDINSTELVEQIRGPGVATLNDGASIATATYGVEPGWFVRVGAHYPTSTPMHLFTGRVTQATKDFATHDVVFQQLSATDITEQISQVELSRTTYAQAVVKDSPIAFWPLDDDSNVAVDISGNGADGEYTSAVVHDPGLADGVVNAAMNVGTTEQWMKCSSAKRFAPAATPADPVNGFSIEFWLKTRTTVKQNRSAAIFTYGNTYGNLATQILLINQGLVFAVDGVPLLSTTQVNDGKLHHIVCTATPDGLGYIYVDGVKTTTVAPANIAFIPTLCTPNYTNDVIVGYSPGGTFSVPLVGTIDDVSMYDFMLADWQIAKHYELGIAGKRKDTLADRVTLLLGASGFDDSFFIADSSAQSSDIYTKPLYEGNLMAELTTLAESYSARVHANARGQIVAYGFDYFPYSVATFADDDSALSFQLEGFTTSIDRDSLHNTVTGSMADGPNVVVSDPSSIGRYGPRNFDIGTIRATSPGAVSEIAERHLDKYKVPKERFKQIKLRPQGDTAIWAVLGTLAVSAKVTITLDGDTKDYLIEGVSHSLAPKFWETTLSVTEAPSDDFWRWGSSTFSQDTRWA